MNSELQSNTIMNYTHAICEKGKTYLNNVGRLNDDGQVVSSISGELFNDLIAKLNKDDQQSFIILPMEDAMKMIDDAGNGMCGQIQEINKEKYNEMLECLPPEKWENLGSFSIFRMREYYTDNITSHYISYKNRYFTAKYRITTTYQSIINDVAAFMIDGQTIKG